MTRDAMNEPEPAAPRPVLSYAGPSLRPGRLALANLICITGMCTGLLGLAIVAASIVGLVTATIVGPFDVTAVGIWVLRLLFGVGVLYLACRLCGAVHGIYKGG